MSIADRVVAQTETITADVVVVGHGGAGSAAAIAAADSGASVIVVEKQPAGGGSTQVSGGNLRLIRDPELAALHFEALLADTTPSDVVKAYVSGLTALPDWLKSLGAEFEPHEQMATEPMRTIRPTSVFEGAPGVEGLGSRVRLKRSQGVTGGEAVWELLSSNCAARSIDIHHGQRAVRLIRDPADGSVTGVVTAAGARETAFCARGGVILSCGGFEWDSDLQLNYLGITMPAYSPPGVNTGDGLRMAQQVGADLHHMSAFAARFGFSVPGFPAAFTAVPPARGVYLVDQLGHRYANECDMDIHSAALWACIRNPVTGGYDRIPSYMVFDDATRRQGPICGRWGSGFNRHVEWSADNQREIDQGWIVSADSIDALAAAIGVPENNLRDTHERYNRAAIEDNDELGRPAEMIEAMPDGPYYALRIIPAITNTQGGPRRNGQGQVLDVHHRPIPGLYSAGELGSMWGPLYPGAGNLTEALVTGQIAGRESAQRAREMNQ